MSEWTDALAGPLLAQHRYGDGIAWAYVASGITEDGGGPRVNTQQLVDDVFDTFGADLRTASSNAAVPIELLVSAVCLVAATHGATAAATHVQYIDGFESFETTPTLCYAGCTGLRWDRITQIVGSTTLEAYLADPQTAIDAAADHMLAAIPETRFQPPMMASAYNADGLRDDGTASWRMAQNTQITNFVGWFNTAVHALQLDATPAGAAPSFMAELLTVGATTPLPPATTSQSTQYFKTESQAAVDAGMMTICESNTSLSTIWSLDDVTTTQMTNLALGVGPGQGLPLGGSTFSYPDRNRVMREMTPGEIQMLYRAMRDYITNIILYDTGHLPNLPGQPVLMT